MVAGASSTERPELRRSQVTGATAMLGMNEKVRMRRKVSDSPRTRRACRRGEGRSQSPGLLDAVVGGDDLARSIEDASA
jgi:hypothetical protein